MPTASSLLLAFGVTAVAGSAVTAWLWLVQRQRAERDEGFKLLSAMRWREFSRLVVDGLRSRGFAPEATEDAAERGQDSVIHLRRDGCEWLLVCKQGTQHRITGTTIDDMTDAIRFHGAKGGVIATLGKTESDACKLAQGRVELIDGDALWPLVSAQLAPSVREEVAGKARQISARKAGIAWAAALALGLFTAMATSRNVEDDMASSPSPTSRPTMQAPPPRMPAAISPAPVSEDEQRDDVIRMVSTLPGVDRAMWSTRSTLMIYLAQENADPVKDICAVVEKYESLRTSRLQLQPPTGATRPARFLQCRTF